MPWNGTGTFQRVHRWASDKAAGIKIRADRMDEETDDIAVGLSNCLTRDGQSPPTAHLPFNGKRLMGIGAPVVGTDAISRDVGDARYGRLSGATFTGVVAAPSLKATSSSGVEGGQVDFARPVTTSLESDPYIDVHVNEFRFVGVLAGITKIFSLSFSEASGKIWHSGNHGSGSGLDADRLRGTIPSTFGLSVLDDADAATARTTLGLTTRDGIGNYAFAKNNSGSGVAYGSTVAGSSLAVGSTSDTASGTDVSLAGTWRALGASFAGQFTLFVRIA
jgi:hypothetical protein